MGTGLCADAIPGSLLFPSQFPSSTLSPPVLEQSAPAHAQSEPPNSMEGVSYNRLEETFE